MQIHKAFILEGGSDHAAPDPDPGPEECSDPVTPVCSCQVFRESGVLPAMPVACGTAQPGEERPPVLRETSCMPEWLKVILHC